MIRMAAENAHAEGKWIGICGELGADLELTEELRFFESAVRSVSGIAGEVLADLVFEQLTWDQMAEKHYISRRSVGNYRRKAIAEMEKLYQRYEDEIVDYMLS